MTLFPFIMYPILGFSDKVFDKDVITSPNGPIGENNNNQNTTNTNNTTLVQTLINFVLTVVQKLMAMKILH